MAIEMVIIAKIAMATKYCFDVNYWSGRQGNWRRLDYWFAYGVKISVLRDNVEDAVTNSGRSINLVTSGKNSIFLRRSKR